LLNPKGIGGFTHGLGGVHHHNTVAEFLYQLTKMLTDDNKEIIEWVNGRIEVHDPPKLEEEVLHKYFRHSKYASFQRQLNYFGFRKLAGKGKMSPCSYVNDDTTNDLRSLLSIKVSRRVLCDSCERSMFLLNVECHSTNRERLPRAEQQIEQQPRKGTIREGQKKC